MPNKSAILVPVTPRNLPLEPQELALLAQLLHSKDLALPVPFAKTVAGLQDKLRALAEQSAEPPDEEKEDE